jgi:hypothetical protein
MSLVGARCGGAPPKRRRNHKETASAAAPSPPFKGTFRRADARHDPGGLTANLFCGGQAAGACTGRFSFLRQRTRSRPTYVTQPRVAVVLTVTPPPSRACHCASCPCTATATGRPAIATCTCAGSNPRSSVTRAPRDAVSVRADAAIGAPHFVPQHHDDTARGTRPVPEDRVAWGGARSASAARSETTTRRRYLAGQKEFCCACKIRSSSANPDVWSASQRVAGDPEQCRLHAFRLFPPSTHA